MKNYGEHTFSDWHGTWEVARLIELASVLTPKEIPIVQLRELDRAVWGKEPMTVREAVEHFRRIQEADLSCPIILSSIGRIMDGCHRLAKAYLEGRSTILAVQFVKDPPPDRIGEVCDTSLEQMKLDLDRSQGHSS